MEDKKIVVDKVEVDRKTVVDKVEVDNEKVVDKIDMNKIDNKDPYEIVSYSYHFLDIHVSVDIFYMFINQSIKPYGSWRRGRGAFEPQDGSSCWPKLNLEISIWLSRGWDCNKIDYEWIIIIESTVSILQGGGIAPSSNCDLCFDIGGII